MVLGLTSEHLTDSRGALMHEQAAEAFSALQARANDAGFQLSVASSYRSYERQLAIFNGKWGGERPVLDDNDRAWSDRIIRPKNGCTVSSGFRPFPAPRATTGVLISIFSTRRAYRRVSRCSLSPANIVSEVCSRI